mgnify:CR=1 FL=1
MRNGVSLEDKGKIGFEDCMDDDKLRVNIEQMATKTIRSAVLNRDENSKVEENNRGE